MNENLYSIELEQSVLSILMITSGVDEYIDQLQEADFYATRHASIFQTIKELYLEGKSFDVEILGDIARKDKNAGFTVEYLIELNTHSMGTFFKMNAYVEKLKEYARRRALFSAGERIKVIASDVMQYDAIDAVAHSEAVLAQLEKPTKQSNLKNAFNLSVDLYAKAMQVIEDRKKGIDKIDGASTGLKALDRQIGILAKGDLVYIGARPSMGKTAFIQTMMLDMAFYQQLPILFHSAEMKSELIMRRLISSMTSINLRDLKNFEIHTQEQWAAFNKASLMLQKAKLMIDDMSFPTIEDIRRNCREMKHEFGFVGAVFIDYLTLIRGTLKSERTDLVIGDVSNKLKALAKEFDCPVICLSQLNRGVEKRPDKRPMMSDLRDSGSIEQDADIILFLYRDEYYNKASKDVGIAEVIASKVRDGEVGTVRLAFEGQYSRFSDLAYEQGDF